MVIRFPLRPEKPNRVETPPPGLTRSGDRRLTPREIEHRERMLQHLARLQASRA
jgi:hypothetical protein